MPVCFPLSFYIETDSTLFSEKTTHPNFLLKDENEVNLGNKRSFPSLVGS